MAFPTSLSLPDLQSMATDAASMELFVPAPVAGVCRLAMPPMPKNLSAPSLIDLQDAATCLASPQEPPDERKRECEGLSFTQNQRDTELLQRFVRKRERRRFGGHSNAAGGQGNLR